MSTRRVMATFASVLFVQACGGHSLELDRIADAMPPDADATAPLVETIPIPDPVWGLIVDDTRLYWLTNYSSAKFQSCLKSSCASTIITYGAAGGGVSFVDAAVARGRVYWHSGYSVYSCPSAGCEGAPTRVVSDPGLTRLSADEDYAYWGSASDIYRCKYSGCGPIPELVAARERPATKLTFHGPNAYWSDRSSNPTVLSSNRTNILYAPKDGSAPPTILSPADTYGVATDSTGVYWADDAGSGTVLTCPLAGCGAEGPVTLATDIGHEGVLAVDTSGLYWTSEAPRDVPGPITLSPLRFCPLTGCGSNATIITPSGVASFAVDDQYVYWTSSSPSDPNLGVNIQRMPKP